MCECIAEAGMKPGKLDEEKEDENYEIMYLFEKGRESLEELAIGNPQFQTQLIRALLVLLTSVNSRAQLLSCKILKNLLVSMILFKYWYRFEPK